MNSKVFVGDINQLNDWYNELNLLNQESIDILNNFNNRMDELDEAWLGNAAYGFKSKMKIQVVEASSVHENMIEKDKFLLSISSSLQNR